MCTNPGLVYTHVSDMAKSVKFQTEHLLELQLPKILLRTAYTGELPKVGDAAVTQYIKAARISEENLFTGWHKLYPSNINLNPVYEIVKGMPKDYLPPLNTPADRIMTAIGDWGNMQNLAVTIGEINRMKGKLFSLSEIIAGDRFQTLIWKALKNDEESARVLGGTFKDVSSFHYFL